jgi:thioredoxin reductase
VRDQEVAVLATSPMSVHQALMFRQWTDRLTLLLHTSAAPTDEQREQLAARGIEVVEGEVSGLEVVDDRLTGVRLASGAVVPARALVVAPQVSADGPLLSSLGVATAEHPSGMGTRVPQGADGATDVPGVWVAGNVTDLRANLVMSAAAGSVAAIGINTDLIAEDTALAVARRSPAAVG